MLGYDAVPRQRRKSLSNTGISQLHHHNSPQQIARFNMRYIYASGGLAFLTICFYLNFIHQSTFDGLSFFGDKFKSSVSPSADFTPTNNMSAAYGDSYWLANIEHQGKAAFNPDFQGYKGKFKVCST